MAAPPNQPYVNPSETAPVAHQPPPRILGNPPASTVVDALANSKRQVTAQTTRAAISGVACPRGLSKCSCVVGQRAVKPVGELVGASCSDHVRELRGRGVGYGDAGEHHKSRPRVLSVFCP